MSHMNHYLLHIEHLLLHYNLHIFLKIGKKAKHDPKWREAMLEELRALEKNKTWDLVKLPPGKKAVSCKWIFTMKQTPEGKIERYKTRLVARGYSQTYGID